MNVKILFGVVVGTGIVLALVLGGRKPVSIDAQGAAKAGRPVAGAPNDPARASKAAPTAEVAWMETKEMAAKNGLVMDPVNGLKFAVPTGWALRGARRRGGETSIQFAQSEQSDTVLTLYYRKEERHLAGAALEAELRRLVEEKTEQRQADSSYPDYKVRAVPKSLRLGGEPAITWAADYFREDKASTERLTRSLSEKYSVLIFLKGPTVEVDRLQETYEEFVRSLSFR